MADPFSITGSAVGVVSLAIQVCKGLEWYLSGVKEAKDKAEQIAAETEELANLLESLESIINKADQSHAVSVTRTGIVSCANAISTIRKKLKPDDRSSDGGIKSSLKRLTKRLAFPFKEAEIKYWKDVLNTIQQNLQTALLALVIDQQRMASEDVRLRFTQLSMDQSAQHSLSLQLRRDTFDKTHLQLAGQSQMLESGFSATSHRLQSLHADVHSLQAQLVKAMSATDTTLDDDVMSMRYLQRKTRKLQRRYAKATCTCRPQTSALNYRSRLLALTCSRTSLHDPQCPQSAFQKAVTNLQLQTTLCSLILGTKMSLAFTLSYGAKFSVNHNLECYRVVHKSSPAFAFIDTLVQSSEGMPQEMFQGEVGRLFRMFELGHASPHDRLSNGETLLHGICRRVGRSGTSEFTFKNLCYLFKSLLSQMPNEAFEIDDEGRTCVDTFVRNVYPSNMNIHIGLLTTLFDHDLQITRTGFSTLIHLSLGNPTVFNELQFETFISPLLVDSELLEAILSKSARQLQHALNQPKESGYLDNHTVTEALIMATVTGWIDGCKTILDTGLDTYDLDTSFFGYTLLTCSAETGQQDMLYFWLLQRTKSSGAQLDFIGSIEDALEYMIKFGPERVPVDTIRLLSSHLLDERLEIKRLMETHGVEHCCDKARASLPDAHVRCMLNALMSEGVDVPQQYWPKRKSTYFLPDGRITTIVLVLESLDEAGFRDISQENFECTIEITCSPLVCYATQRLYFTGLGNLSECNVIARWFLSKGADLREIWPGSDTTALHCLAWRSALYLRRQCFYSTFDNPFIIGKSWTYEDFEFFVKEEISDDCECGCSRSGCDFLSCFWKEFFTTGRWFPQFPAICEGFEDARDLESVHEVDRNRDEMLREVKSTRVLFDLTLWVDKAASTLNLDRLIHEYIRLFVFSYLELRHTCCDITRIQHFNRPDHTKRPYPRYSPKELRRITKEDAHLRKRLEELVPALISQYDSYGGKLEDFVIEVLIPTMRKTAKELKEEDKALYAAGRRELGVVMDGYEDEDEQGDSDVEEEEEDSDDEY